MKNYADIYGNEVIGFLVFFLNHGENEEILIAQLRNLECKIREEIFLGVKDDKGLWLRFSKDDTLATTINDIERDLKTFNRETLLESFKLAVENNYIEIYFS